MPRKTLIFGNGLGMALDARYFSLTLWQLCGPTLVHFLTYRSVGAMRSCPNCWGKTAPAWIGRYPAQTAVALTADWVSVFRQMGQFFISANTHVPHRALQGGAAR
jgi:hypothetical protein